jgi:hypothetical protein
MSERDLDVVATDTHGVIHTQRSRFLVAHARDAFGHFFHHAIAVVLVRTAVVGRNLSVAQPCNHHVVRLGDVLRMLEDVEVLVLDLLTLCALLAEVDGFCILFRVLDCLEELATCIGCTRDEIE